jgi:hypothetical protein
MISVVDLAATSLARAARQARRAPPLPREPGLCGSRRSARLLLVFIAVGASLGALGSATEARAQAAPACAAALNGAPSDLPIKREASRRSEQMQCSTDRRRIHRPNFWGKEMPM